MKILGDSYTPELEAELREAFASELKESLTAEVKVGVEAEVRANLEQELTQAIEARLRLELDGEIERLNFEHQLVLGLEKAGVIDVELVRVKLDLSALALGEDGKILGLEEQLAQIKEVYPMLFVNSQQMVNALSGLRPVANQSQGKAITRQEFSNMSYQQRLELLKSAPEIYYNLTK